MTIRRALRALIEVPVGLVLMTFVALFSIGAWVFKDYAWDGEA